MEKLRKIVNGTSYSMRMRYINRTEKWDILGIGTEGSSIFKYRDTVIDISERAKRKSRRTNNLHTKLFRYKHGILLISTLKKQ